MPARRVLYLDSNQLDAYLWRAGSLTLEGRYPANGEGVAAFTAYVAARRGSLFHLVADVADEGFHYEAVPHVAGKDRQALLERKLSQYFYGSPLTCAVSLGREKAGRRDERLLFAALTRPQAVETWLAVLRAAEARVAGIYSLPLATPGVAARLGMRQPRLMMVSAGRGGVRQTFLEKGQLRFSRFTPLPDAGLKELATACAQEAARTYQYLVGQRLLPRGTVLPVLVLANSDHWLIFSDRCRSTDELEVQLVDTGAAAKAAGLKTAPAGSLSETLFLHAVVANPPPAQFAAPAELRPYRLWQASFALQAAGAAVLVACLAVAGRDWLEVMTLRERLDTLSAAARTDQQRYASLMASLPPLPVPVQELRAVVGGFERIEQQGIGPLPLYRELAAVLDRQPRVELDRIEWSLPGVDGAPSRDADNRPPRYGEGMIFAHLTGEPSLDQRAQIEAVNAFAAALRRNPDLRVTVIRMPIDIESGKALRSGDTLPAAEAPRFALRVGEQP